MSDREIIRLYTRARKFPQLIGRTPDGRRIWGGPYTVTQFLGAGAVAAVLWKTAWLWARFSAPLNFAFFVAAAWGTVFVLGKLPQGGRNPMSIVTGFGKAATAIPSSSVRHLMPRLAAPHGYFGVVEVVAAADPAAADAVEDAVVEPRRLAASAGVMQLVAAAGHR